MSEPVIRVYIGRNLVIEERIVSDRVIIGEEIEEELDVIDLEFEEQSSTVNRSDFKVFSRTVVIQDCAGNILNIKSEIANELNLCRECLVSEVGEGFFICKDCLDLQYLEDISYDRLKQDIALE